MEDNDFIIRTEFEEYKGNVSEKLGQILEGLKPQFTSAQITSFLLLLVGFFATTMIYITSIKSDARNNTTEIENIKLSDIELKKADAKTVEQYENIMEILTEIKVELATQKKQK